MEIQTPPVEVVTATEPPKKTPRKRAAAKKSEAPNPTLGFANALKFVAICQARQGAVEQMFCNIVGHYVAASNGVLTVATPIEEDLQACPQTLTLLDALSNVSGEVSITQLSPEYLSVSSGLFRAMVPCVPPSAVPITPPDPSIAVVTDDLKRALEICAKIAIEGSPRAEYAAVLLQANTAVATNGVSIVEAWHGIDLPPGLLMPKASALAIAKATKKLAGFGYSPNSATFWFEDGSFIKTQLFSERFPNYVSVIEGSDYWTLPDAFFAAVAAIAPFTEEGKIYFRQGRLVSAVNEEIASTYQLAGLPDNVGYSAKLLLFFQALITKVEFTENGGQDMLRFVGDRVRGAIAGLARPTEKLYVAETETATEPPPAFQTADDWSNPGFAQEQRDTSALGSAYSFIKVNKYASDDEIPF